MASVVLLLYWCASDSLSEHYLIRLHYSYDRRTLIGPPSTMKKLLHIPQP